MSVYYQTYDQTPQEEITPGLIRDIWEFRNECLIKDNKTPENPYIYDKFEKYLDWYYDRGNIALFKRNRFSSRTSAWNSFIKYFEDEVRKVLSSKDKSLFSSSGDDSVFKLRREKEKKFNLSLSNPVSIKIGGTKRRKSKGTRRKLK